MEEKEKTKCPNCGSSNTEAIKKDVEAENEIATTSNPPEAQSRCKDCGYEFGYDEVDSNQQ